MLITNHINRQSPGDPTALLVDRCDPADWNRVPGTNYIKDSDLILEKDGSERLNTNSNHKKKDEQQTNDKQLPFPRFRECGRHVQECSQQEKRQPQMAVIGTLGSYHVHPSGHVLL